MEGYEPYIAVSHLSTLYNETGDWRAERPVMNRNRCNKCSLCWTYCPDTAIELDTDGYYKILYEYCKGCGICVEVCSRKAITMEREYKPD
jgi:2-oxoisovalerate ferredoxin oxidoreductase delta subunit